MCALQVETYLTVVTEMTTRIDYADIHAHVMAGTLAATSGMIAGGCLVLAPVVFGAEWLTYALTLLAAIVGLVGASLLFEPSGLLGWRLEIPMTGSSKCVCGLCSSRVCG